MKFIFTRVAKHRTFHHEPIYYNEEKEEREERIRRAKEELGILTDEEKETGYADRIRGGMRRRIKPHYEVVRSSKRKSNLRLVVILIALMILGLYLIQSGMKWLTDFFG